jgi:hypothetical protein
MEILAASIAAGLFLLALDLITDRGYQPGNVRQDTRAL